MMNLNVSEFEIQKALGHSKIETTQIYAQVQNYVLRESLDRLANDEKNFHSAIIQPSSNFTN